MIEIHGSDGYYVAIWSSTERRIMVEFRDGNHGLHQNYVGEPTSALAADIHLWVGVPQRGLRGILRAIAKDPTQGESDPSK